MTPNAIQMPLQVSDLAFATTSADSRQLTRHLGFYVDPPAYSGSVPERMVFARRLNDVGTSSVIGSRLKLVSREGQLLLFDLIADPQETTDPYGETGTQMLQAALEEFNRKVRLEQTGATTDGTVSR